MKYSKVAFKLTCHFPKTPNTDRKVLCLGLIQSFFEGSMYTFVLEWTPVLDPETPGAEGIPHGIIFAAFMVIYALRITMHILKNLDQV